MASATGSSTENGARKFLSADDADFRRLWGRNKTFKHGDAEEQEEAAILPDLAFLPHKSSAAIPRFGMAMIFLVFESAKLCEICG